MGYCLLTHDFSSIQSDINNEDKLGSVILRQKGKIWGGGCCLAEWLSACLACRKPWVQFLLPEKKRRKGEEKDNPNSSSIAGIQIIPALRRKTTKISRLALVCSEFKDSLRPVWATWVPTSKENNNNKKEPVSQTLWCIPATSALRTEPGGLWVQGLGYRANPVSNNIQRDKNVVLKVNVGCAPEGPDWEVLRQDDQWYPWVWVQAEQYHKTPFQTEKHGSSCVLLLQPQWVRIYTQ